MLKTLNSLSSVHSSWRTSCVHYSKYKNVNDENLVENTHRGNHEFTSKAGNQTMNEDDPSMERKKFEQGLQGEEFKKAEKDVENYNSSSRVSLHSVMQSQVPEPYRIYGRNPSHLNMPGGGNSLNDKYTAGQRQGPPSGIWRKKFSTFCLTSTNRCYSTEEVKANKIRDDKADVWQSDDEEVTEKKRKWFGSKEDFMKAVATYGSTVLIFHITMSLGSLGILYTAIVSGLDVGALLSKAGFEPSHLSGKAGTFLVAYAVHKSMAPFRIAITLGTTPFLVKWLRKMKIVKS